MELPADSRSDEITLQVVSCAGCGFAGIAVYEESRRGSLDTESVDHRGYRATPEDVAAVRRTISKCNNPRNPRCKCAAHTKLGRTNSWGRWVGLQALDLGPRFDMRL
jgi:hypothetical protein